MKKVVAYAMIALGVALFSAGMILQAHRAEADPWHGAPTRIRDARLVPLPNVAAVIRRDPFAGAPAPPKSDPAGAATGVPAFGTSGVPQMVPNPGAFAPAAGEAYVIGTMIGGDQRPLALVREGNKTSVVGIGDIFAGRTIAKIEPQGLVFADGSRLAVDNAADNGGAASPPQASPLAAPAIAPAQPSFEPPKPPEAATPTPPPSQDPRRNIFDFGATPSPNPLATRVPLPRLYTPQPGQPSGPRRSNR